MRSKSLNTSHIRCGEAVSVLPAGDSAQFVIATHSPILLAVPGANVYELGSAGIMPTAYEDLDAVRLTRGFLDAPERYVRAAQR